jgi:hypothetical protein
MTSFLDLLTHYPGFVPSVLMGALLMFWLLAILGVLDFDSFGPHFDTDLSTCRSTAAANTAEAPETLMALGLDKLPFSIVDQRHRVLLVAVHFASRRARRGSLDPAAHVDRRLR